MAQVEAVGCAVLERAHTHRHPQGVRFGKQRIQHAPAQAPALVLRRRLPAGPDGLRQAPPDRQLAREPAWPPALLWEQV